MKNPVLRCWRFCLLVIFGFSLTAFGTDSCVTPPSGLVGWWKGDSNTLDSWGANDGYVTNGSVSYTNGEVDAAFHYDNSGGYVEIPAAPSLNVGQSSGFTLEGWIQPADLVDQLPLFEWQFNINNEHTGTHFWISAIGGAGCLYANIADTAGASHAFSSAPGLITGGYQHVALTYDKATGIATIYRNGIIVAETELGSFTPNTTGDLLLGERTYLDRAPQYHYVGNLDEMGIYNRALSSNEVAAIYNAGADGKCTSISSDAPPTITAQPINQTVSENGTASFSVTATGSSMLSYQWYGPGSILILGANSSTLDLPNVQQGNAGAYFVLVTNLYGFAVSSNATLTVTDTNSSGSCIPAPSGLVGWWKGDSNTLDSWGANDGYVTNGSVSYTNGEVGAAFHYDNSGGYVEIPAASSLNVGQGSGFTLEGWIQPADLVDQLPLFEWQYNASNGYSGPHFWISDVGGAGCLYANIVDTNNGSHAFYSAPGLITPNYQHVALTYDKASGIATIYRNGTIVAETGLGSFTPNTTGDLLLGERTYLNRTPQYHYVGNLDEMSVYSRALSSNEIAAIYNAGADGKCTSNSSNTPPVITEQPPNQSVSVGGTASFSVTATGSPILQYQWYGPGESVLVGATNSTLTVLNVQLIEAGDYFVLVTNLDGFEVSSNATLTVTSTNSSGSCTPAPSGLVGWWKGDSNTLDSWGANAGYVTNGSVSYTNGEVDAAFHYDNSGGYVEIPAAPSLNVGQGSGFTLEGWIQPADLVDQLPLFEWQYNVSTEYAGTHFWVSDVGGPGCLYANIVDTNNTSHSFYSAPGLITANYQHVALTYDKASGIATIYRNGTIVAETVLGTFTPNTTGDLLLGERTYLNRTPQYHYVGNLDEMSVYSRALSSNEIAAIYNAGADGKCTSVSSNAPSVTQIQIVNTNGTAGSSLDVPIVLYATGAENALSFSLNFDPSRLTYSGVMLGSGASNAFILPNVSQVGSGKLGIELALPSGQAFGEGEWEIAHVSFTSVVLTGTQAVVTVVAFTNQPIAELVSDSLGNSLSNIFVNGSVTLSPTALEGDAAPVPSGNGTLDLFDWVQVGRYVAGLDIITNGAVFQKVDCAPRATLGDGQLDVTDWVQAGRYAAGLDPLTPVGGPTGPVVSNSIAMSALLQPLALTDRQITVRSGAVVKGLAVTLPINLQAQGNESALGFSLNFDPKALQYVNTTKGGTAGSAVLNVNAIQAATGKLGIALSLPIGSQFPAGLDEIARVTFVAVGTATNNSVAFANQPVECSISDANATELTADYFSSSIVVNPQPNVALSHASGTSALSWPVWAGDFQLQAAGSLIPPINWTNVPMTFQTNGDQIQIILPTPDSQTFFRLYHP